MNKKLLTAAVAAALTAPAAMAGDVTIYGQMHIATTNYDGDINTADAWDISSHESALGFKGTEGLGNGLTAVWQLELLVQPSDTQANGNTVNGNDGITYRNSFLGLTGSWGTAVIGRHDTPLKISTGSLDLFGDTVADYNSNGASDEPAGAGNVGLFTVGPAALLGGQGLGFVDLRVDQAIAYISPNMNGLTIAAAIVQPGMDRPTTAVGNADGFSEAYSIAALYSNGPFFASLAVEKLSEDLVEELIGNAALVGVLDGEDRWRLGLGYTANGFHVGLVYEDQDHAIDGVDAQRWQLSGSYTFGNNVVKLAYGENEIDVSNTTAAALAGLGVGLVGGGVVAATYGGTDIEQWSLGLDHNFSKNTKVYAVYTDVDVDHSQPTLAGTNEGDWDAFSVGMVHKF
jgi:predicted porin